MASATSSAVSLPLPLPQPFPSSHSDSSSSNLVLTLSGPASKGVWKLKDSPTNYGFPFLKQFTYVDPVRAEADHSDPGPLELGLVAGAPVMEKSRGFVKKKTII